jgi:REP element-mobilizing transposase RayT
MSRTRRIQVAGHLYHVISRFVDHEFRLDGPEARRRYLDFLGRALESTDTGISAFALMSTHLHLGATAGERPISDLMQSVNGSYAAWVNRRDGRLGPVIADRPTIVDVTWRPVHAIAYVHNNPVRAGLVAHASESSWTSHRAYLGVEPAPPWLKIDDGLARCRFATDATGRERFDAAVRALEREGRDPTLSEQGAGYARRTIRSHTGSRLIEVGTPRDEGDSIEWPVMRRVLHADVAASVKAVAASIATRFAVSDWRSQTGRVSRAKQLLFYVSCLRLGIPAAAVYTLIDMSRSRASEVLNGVRRAPPPAAHVALVLDDLAASTRDALTRTG